MPLLLPPPFEPDLKCVRGACLLISSSSSWLEASVAGLVARAVCVVIFVSVNISYVECCHHHPRMPPLSLSFFLHTAAAARFWLQLLCKCSLILQHTRSHKCSPLCVVYLNNQQAEIKLCCGSIDVDSCGFLVRLL